MSKQMRLPVRLKFTREGKWFFWITLGVGFAAINTGNNLLYLLLGMMLSLIVISGILCNISLSKLEVERRLPRHLFARTPFLVTLSVTNQKRFFPSFSIEVEDRMEGQKKGKKCYFLKVSSGRTQQTAYRLSLERRGAYVFRELQVSSKFPFALFIKTRRVTLRAEVLVFPRISAVSLPRATARRLFGEGVSARRGQGADFFALRDMRPGDDLRWIHWPSSARTGSFQVREFEQEHRPLQQLLLWHAQSDGEAVASSEQLDPAIDFAASLLVAFFRRRQPVFFSTLTQRFVLKEQFATLEAALTHLALLAPMDVGKRPRAIRSQDSPWVIVPACLHPPEGIPTQQLLSA